MLYAVIAANEAAADAKIPIVVDDFETRLMKVLSLESSNLRIVVG
jgi:hypothetical protein